MSKPNLTLVIKAIIAIIILTPSCREQAKVPLLIQENKRLIYLPRGSYTTEELDSIVKSYGFASLSHLDSVNYLIEDTILIHDTIMIYKNKVTNIGTAQEVNIGQ